MSRLVRPLAAHLAAPDRAAEVAMPPVSSVTTEQWARLTEEKPNSFLHVMRSAIDSDGSGAERPVDIADGRQRLEEMVSSGVLVPQRPQAYYLYRLTSDDASKTGVVADVSTAGLQDGRIRRHEATKVETERRIADHLRDVGAHANPVALTHPVDGALRTLVAGMAQRPPAIDFLADDGVQQSIWVVDDPSDVAALDDALAAISTLYITDGHHRCAAAARLSRESGDPGLGFVGVLFPEDEIRLLEYNRCVTRIDAALALGLPDLLRPRMQVDDLHIGWADEARPKRHGTVSMWDGRRWHRITLPEPRGSDPVSTLDVSRLQDEVLGPVLGIIDPRTDPRLVYVPGAAGMAALEQRSGAVCFAMHPTSVAEVMAVADAGLVMPPKSTWFEPKVHGGLIVKITG